MIYLWIYLSLGILYAIYEIYEISKLAFVTVDISKIPMVILLWPLAIMKRVLRT